MKIQTIYRLLMAVVLTSSGFIATIENSFSAEASLIKPVVKPKVSADKTTPMSLSQYGPVKMGDTLSNIAYTLFPDGSLQLEQIIWSLYQQNPKAFQKNDINRLKIGSVLIVPAVAEIRSLDNNTARNKIRERNNNSAEDLSKLKQQIEKTQSDYSAQQDKKKLLKSQLIELENQVNMLLKQNSRVDSAIDQLNKTPAK